MGGGRDHLVLLSYIVYEKTESRKREVICQYSVWKMLEWGKSLFQPFSYLFAVMKWWTEAYSKFWEFIWAKIDWSQAVPNQK